MSDQAEGGRTPSKGVLNPPDFTPFQRLAALLACTGMAVAQQLLPSLGTASFVFARSGIRGFSIVWIALLIVLAPPLVLWAIDLVVSKLHPRAGKAVHVATVWFLLVLAVVPIAKFRIGVETRIWIALIAILAASALTAMYLAYDAIGKFFRLVAFLPFASLAVFLLASPVGGLRASQPVGETVEVSPADEAATPVVFLMLDEIPTKSMIDETGTIDRELFPNYAALADEATWYRNFTTTSTWTLWAAPTLMAGHEGVDSAGTWRAFPENLFTELGPTHEVHATESMTRLCGLSSCTSPTDYGRFVGQMTELYWQKVSLDTPQLSLGKFEENVRTDVDPALVGSQDIVGLPNRFVHFLDELNDESAQPGLHFLHLILPHQTWRYFEDGQEYHIDEASRNFPAIASENDQGPWVAALTEQRHMYQMVYSDRVVGALIDHMKANGTYDDALIVIVGDHGVSFEPDNRIREVAEDNLDSLAFTPLFIKYPNQQQGGTDDSNVMSIDVLPTILDVLGLDSPESVTGTPIGSAEQLERGDTKYILDIANWVGEGVRDTVRFEAAEHFPKAEERWILPDAGPDALAAIAGVQDLIGTNINDLSADATGRVTVDSLANHERPSGLPDALVVGRTSDYETGTLVIAADDIIVSASPLYNFRGQPGSFAAMMPQDLIGEDKTLRVVLLKGDGATELTIDR